MNTVAVVGHATLAEAICRLSHINQAQVLHWQPEAMGPLPEALPQETFRSVELAALADSPLIFVCVPIAQLEATCHAIGDVISARHILIHCCRELERHEDGSPKLASEIMRAQTPTHRVGLLTGPIRAADIAQGLPAAGVIASSFGEVHELVAKLLVSDGFRLYRGRDLRGAELSAAYTRAIAFVAGVAEAMQQGPSIKATIFARGLAEASRFVALYGGQAQTAFGMSGAGNLYADAHLPGSMTFNLGAKTFEQDRFDVQAFSALLGAHGVEAFMALMQHLYPLTRHKKLNSNIFEAAFAMLADNASARAAAKHLMSLPVMLDE